ncbi:MAG: sugar phosphate isomerase/epimerase [Actinobacteria bacterium]|nr:sugar phosphate isomerase/epimerase [Actinomycetota bacterium]
MAGTLTAQLYTLRHLTVNRTALADALQRLRAIGYAAIEFGGVPAVLGPNADTTVQEARKLCDDCGLRCVSAHKRWSELRSNTAHAIDDLHTLGARYVVVPIFVDEYDRYALASYHQFVTDLAPVAAQLRSAGLTLGFHNHAYEFTRASPGGLRPFDVLIEARDADLALELDVYWAAVAGVNPVRVLERIHGRAPIIHLKDLEPVPEPQGGPNPFYAPVGEGNLDWDGIIPAAKAAGTQIWVVEQDLCRRDAFDCLRSSFEFLKARLER